MEKERYDETYYTSGTQTTNQYYRTIQARII